MWDKHGLVPQFHVKLNRFWETEQRGRVKTQSYRLLDQPALSSSRALPSWWTCSQSLDSLRYSQTSPLCWGSSNVSRSPALFHVLNWNPTENPPKAGASCHGNWRKLRGPGNVTAMETGSAQAKVRLPWERNKQSRGRERGWDRNMITSVIKEHKTWILMSCRGRVDATLHPNNLISKSPWEWKSWM